MATEISTATGHHDLYTKMVAFVTANSTLVGLGQQWIKLREYVDNIDTYYTNFTEAVSTSGVIRSLDTYRYDCRTFALDSEATTNGYFNNTDFINGTSYVAWKFRSAKTVTKVRVKVGPAGNCMNNFSIYHSDDNVTYTLAAEVTSGTYATNEAKTHTFTPAGSHLYWKIVPTSVQGSSVTISWASLLLLDATDVPCNHYGSECLLKAPGLAGTDEIFTGIRSEYNSLAGWYNIFFNAYIGYNSAEPSFLKQPGAIQKTLPCIAGWNDAMDYKFVASGRSLRVALKVGTNFQGGYLGFYTPYASPTQFPYPIFVGGSMMPAPGARTSGWVYSNVSASNSNFTTPATESTLNGTSDALNANAYVMALDGTWLPVANRGSGSETFDEMTVTHAGVLGGNRRGIYPRCISGTTGVLPYVECLSAAGAQNGYLYEPCIIIQRAPSVMVYGELEGVFVVSGSNNAAENTSTISGTVYHVYQNTYRTAIQEFWALSSN